MVQIAIKKSRENEFIKYADIRSTIKKIQSIKNEDKQDEMFDSYPLLRNVTIPNSVSFIGYRAFYYCTSLVEMNIPNSVNY